MERKANIASALALALSLALVGCASSPTVGGAAFSPASSIVESSFDPGSALTTTDASIDVSHTNDGYIGACATDVAHHLKLQVTHGEMSYNYDLPADGTPIVIPVNMGDGSYTIRVMRNTGQNNYVETGETSIDATLTSEFAPFLVPNVFCNYSQDSACVAKARDLVRDATTQGEAVQKICDFIVDNVSYDTEKAHDLSGKSGYIPNPDDTLAAGKGICFDFASLGAAMLRSQGIPAQIVTGYVSPQNVYHAWVMVYIDGTWKSTHFSVEQNAWSRLDLTLAADNSDTKVVGDGKQYTNRYTY